MAKRSNKIEDLPQPKKVSVWVFEPLYHKDGKIPYMGGRKQKITKISDKTGKTHSGLKITHINNKWCMVQ